MPALEGGALWYVGQDSASPRIDALLKRGLVADAIPGKPSAPQPVEQVSPIRADATKPVSRAAPGGAAAPEPDKTPVLLSEIDGAIETGGERGKMILHLEVDAAGEVEFSEVIYSELPDEVGWELQRRFSGARFRPAVRNGREVSAPVLLRVDVD